LIDTVISFGKYKGSKVSEVPLDYVAWLATGGGDLFSVPDDITEAARKRLASTTQDAFRRYCGAKSKTTSYVVDISYHGNRIFAEHDTFEDALNDVAENYCEPDVRKDRILIWEILGSGHKKVVWRFTGFNVNDDEYIVPQCALPGHLDSLLNELI